MIEQVSTPKSITNDGEHSMAQGILPYKYEEEKRPAGMTSLAGLPLYLDLAVALGIPGSIGRHLSLRPSQDWTGDRLIAFAHERCGKSEEAHAVLKEDLAGGRLPSGGFGENAAWWWITVLAFNLNTAMKRLALGESWTTRRMKAIRFCVINLPGRIIEHARQIVIRLVKDHPSFVLLVEARKRIMRLAPSG